MSDRYKSFTKEECLKWKINQDKNPRTNYTLIKTGKLYNLIKQVRCF